MLLKRATVFALQIPFRLSVAHATHDRHFCDSVVLRLEAASGQVGYGEGVARPYVGGEDVEEVLRQLPKNLLLIQLILIFDDQDYLLY